MREHHSKDDADKEAVLMREQAREDFAKDVDKGKYNHLFPERAKRLAAKHKP